MLDARCQMRTKIQDPMKVQKDSVKKNKVRVVDR